MALMIDNPVADILAKRLSKLSGRPVEAAVIDALREELRGQSPQVDKGALKQRLRAIAAECSALPDVDSRGIEEIVPYGEIGLPR